MTTTSLTVTGFLRGVLAKSACALQDVREQAEKLGFKWSSVLRASRDLGVKKQRGKGGVELWSLAESSIDKPVVPAVATAAVVPSSISQLASTLEKLRKAGEPIEIFRILPGLPTPAYVTTVSAHDFSLAWLKRQLGGGRYVIAGLPEVAIEGRPLEYIEPGTEAVPVGPGYGAPKPAAPQPDSMNDKLFALVLENMRSQQAKATENPIQQALQIVELLEKRHTATDATTTKRTPSEIAAFLRELREMGVDLGMVMGGDDDDEDDGRSFPEVLEKFAPGFNALATKFAGTGTTGQPPEPGTDMTPKQLAPVFPSTPIGQIVAQLYPSLGLINAQVRMRTPPVDVAHYLLDRVPDEMFAVIDEARKSPQFVADFMECVSPHIPGEMAPWYTELAASVESELRKSDESASGALRANGDATRPGDRGTG